jgi:hypothetical protein
MPFNGRSCLVFALQLQRGHIPIKQIDRLLTEHALGCTCPCFICRALRERWVQLGQPEDLPCHT